MEDKIIDDKCLLCRRNFDWHETIIWKMPENLWFCLECTKKFDDPNTYRGLETWLVLEYTKWLELEFVVDN